ncbi:unnamed protein product [Rotaria sordida]|uniref:Uncharacterized protein n=1 Tax=Rotaria sordida TaxID=392033 RepID=A0A815KS10_9BILA|nr:unnamed protein product [Rotaria sordida]CAF1549154.1 unnamed protein product [Rotaria sordida]
MRNGELLMVKFADKKATGDKEIYVIDSKGTANIVQVERFEKGGVKKYILKPSSFVDYNRNMGGVDLSDSSLHHACMDRKSYRWLSDNEIIKKEYKDNEVHKQAQELELQIASHSQSTWSTIQIKERKKYEIAIQNLILSAVYLCQQDQPIN